jgi:hypothetical protein
MHGPSSSYHRLLPLLALLALKAHSFGLAQSALPDSDDEVIIPNPALLTLERIRALYGEPAQRIGADLRVY